jgi:hypothetical protein
MDNEGGEKTLHRFCATFYTPLAHWCICEFVQGCLVCQQNKIEQTDGQSEVANRTIAMYMCYLARDRPHSWLQWLPWAEFCCNSSYQSTLCATVLGGVWTHYLRCSNTKLDHRASGGGRRSTLRS